MRKLIFLSLVFLMGCSKNAEMSVRNAKCTITQAEAGDVTVSCDDGTILYIPPNTVTVVETITETVEVPVYIEVPKLCKKKKDKHEGHND